MSSETGLCSTLSAGTDYIFQILVAIVSFSLDLERDSPVRWWNYESWGFTAESNKGETVLQGNLNRLEADPVKI